MAINATLSFGGIIRESGLTGIEFADETIINHTVGTKTSMNASTTPDATDFGGAEVALIAGAKTLDLTAVQGVNETVSGSGNRLRWIYLKNTGSANMTIAKGASNGFAGLGSSFSIVLAPGKQFAMEVDDAASVIGGANKTLDVAGTGTDTFLYAVIFG